MATTAEGVETAEQLASLRDEGCTEVQGYYFSPPRPAREVAGLITSINAMRMMSIDSTILATADGGTDSKTDASSKAA